MSGRRRGVVRRGLVSGAASSSSNPRQQSSHSQHHLIIRRRRPSAAVAVITMALVLVLRPAQAAAALVGEIRRRSAVVASAPAFLHAGAPRPVGRPPTGGGWAMAAASDEGRGQGKEEEDPAAARAALLEEGRRRRAKAEAQRAVMMEARKEKMRRHKRKREGQLKQLSEAERARRRAQEAAAGAVMEWLYEYERSGAEDPTTTTPHEHTEPRRLCVAVDLWYDKSDSQYSSLARQLGCAYGFIRKRAAEAAAAAAGEDGGGEVDEAALAAAVLPPPSYLPCVHLTAARGEVVEALAKNGGDAWRWRRHERPVFEVFPLERLVYLTPDSPNVLEAIDPAKVYVVGGLVDRVVLKGRSLGRAQAHGVATARLPLPEFFKRAPNGRKYLSNLCLAVDRVIEILMRVERRGGDWEGALRETFPQAVTERRGDGGGGGGVNGGGGDKGDK